MKKIASMLIAAAFAFGMSACTKQDSQSDEADAQPVAQSDTHSSENSLDWEGVYVGTLPSAGPGMNVTLTLRADRTYAKQTQYIDRGDETFTDEGMFEWLKGGSMIKLDVKDAPPYYQVGENQLIQLDMDANLITGEHAEDYVLKKQLE